MQADSNRVFTVGMLSAFLLIQALTGFALQPKNLDEIDENHYFTSSLDYLEIIGPERVVQADESVPLDLRWHDRNGNNFSVLLPLENWSAENGNFVINGDYVEWRPTLVGKWQISAQAEDVQATIEITVVNGTITMVWIDAEYEKITADDETYLYLQAEDSRGNRWPISAEWSVVEPEAAGSLVSDNSGTRFIGGPTGEWNIGAVHSRSEGDLNASLTIEVIPGSLVRIDLPTDGTTVSTDDAVDLAPILSDADGNTIEEMTLNWTINGEDFTQEIVMSGNIWQPETTGDFLIEAEILGRVARARMHVVQGAPHRVIIETDLMTSSVTESGSQFTVSTFAEDMEGNREPCQVNWELGNGHVEFEETTQTGVYHARGLGKGTWELMARNSTASGTLTLQVEVGEPVDLRIGPHSGSGEQGDTISMLIELVDYGGNQVPMNTNKLDVETNAGRLSYDGDSYWLLHLEEPGDSQKVVIQYEDWEAQTFVDVEPTGIDWLMGTSVGQMLLGGFGAAIVLIALLFFILRRNKNPQEHWDMEYEWEPSDLEDSETETIITSTSQQSQQIENHVKESTLIQPSISTVVEAQKTTSSSGVLQALSGTVQGQSGWYLSANGENQYWEVNAQGQWNRRN